MGLEQGRVANGEAVISPLVAAPDGAADRAARIYGDIHRAVVEQRLPPGTKLPEDQLGQHFGVSRTLVRSALQALARDGIVVLARNRGASIASPGPEEARELFEARRVIEAVTTARAAERAAPGVLDTLDTVLHEGRMAAAAGDRGRAIRLSGQFHLDIAAIARQTVLDGFLQELVARTSLVIALYGHRGRSDCGDAEHTAIVDALRRRDAPRAVALMTDHLRHIEADLDLAHATRPVVSIGALLSNSL